MRTKFMKCAVAALLVLAVAVAGGTPMVKAADVGPAYRTERHATDLLVRADTLANSRADQPTAGQSDSSPITMAFTPVGRQSDPTEGVARDFFTSAGSSIGAAIGALIGPLFGLDPFTAGVIGAGVGAGAGGVLYNLLQPADAMPAPTVSPAGLRPLRP